MSGPLFLSITTRNHISGIVSATISRNPDTPNECIRKYKPLRTPASSLAHRPCYNPVKHKRKRPLHREHSNAFLNGASNKNDDVESPLNKRAKLDPKGRIPECYSAGGLLIDPHSLSTPGHYRMGQVKWAEAMAHALLQGAKKRWNSSRLRRVEICGDEHVRVLTGVEESTTDLADEYIVGLIAMTGAYACHAGSGQDKDQASSDDVLKLSRLLYRLRAWLGLCKDLENMLEAYEKVVNQ